MSHAPHRTWIALLAVVVAVMPAACGSGPPPGGRATRVVSPQPRPPGSAMPATPTASAPTSAPGSSAPGSSAPATSASAGTSPPTGPAPTGTGLRGRTVVLNCPADRADPPCPATPVPARIVVLDPTGKTVITTVDTDADGSFTVALPAGSYQIRAARTSGNTARRPTIRQVTVTAGHFATVTVRLRTGLS
ncbi:carboxypeptidase-like regulatory domain-containing protein [Actinoplanes sp. CA-030573]|uniref:carboxypeptidase-like regulatory domain-containing protein n=1 Tax=Actinoplanes sp. CA-030573 TaxID=3239898 RepID=UPI003D8F7082